MGEERAQHLQGIVQGAWLVSPSVQQPEDELHAAHSHQGRKEL